jgi:hypothetical protein
MRRPKQEEQSQPDRLPLVQKFDLNLHWNHPVNKNPIREARNLYLKEYNYERIFLLTGVPPNIFLLRSKVWAKIKEKQDERIIHDIRKKAISAQSKEFVEKGLKIGLKFVDRLLKREEEISAKDWKLISDSISNLHRIQQLELGKPTDIAMYESMSPEQMVEYLKEVQRQLGDEHEMSMFSPREDIPEDQLLAEYAKTKDGTHNIN